MFILVNKPKGITSHGVVAKVRKIISMDESSSHRLRRIKVGHAGTLDPNATGLLIIGIGRESTKKLEEQDTGKIITNITKFGKTVKDFKKAVDEYKKS